MSESSAVYLLLLLGSAQGDDGLAVLSVDDLAHSAVDSGQAAEDTLVAGDHGDGVVAGEASPTADPIIFNIAKASPKCQHFVSMCDANLCFA